MIQQVFCTGCGAGGRLPVTLAHEQVDKKCGTCHHETESKSAFHFCTIPCFLAWAKKQEGLPCGLCRGTGWSFGFQENGVCWRCNGAKVITSNTATERSKGDGDAKA